MIVLASWSLFYLFNPNYKVISCPQLWKPFQSRTTWCRFWLCLQVEQTTGRNGAKYVKAVTLKNWMTHLVHCIVKFGHELTTNEQSGLTMLVQHRLMEQLEQEVAVSMYLNHLSINSTLIFFSYWWLPVGLIPEREGLFRSLGIEINGGKTIGGSIAWHIYGPIADMGWDSCCFLHYMQRVFYHACTSTVCQSEKGKFYLYYQ